MLREFPRERLYEAVANELKRHIAEAGLKVGDRLAPEQELCKRLNIGRTSLREALRLLQTMGLVEVRAGRGTYVCGDVLDSPLTRMIEPLLDQSTKLLDLAEVREPLELLAVRLAAERRTEQHLERMRCQLESDREKVEQGHYGSEDDLGFHHIVFEAASNQVLLQFISTVDELLRQFRQARLEDSEQVQKLTLAEHTAIYEAIRDQDVGEAVRAMRTQVRGTARSILTQVEQVRQGTDCQPRHAARRGNR